MQYQVLNCPNCGGAGCPTCQNTGKVRVAADQLQKLKSMIGQPNNSVEANASATAKPFNRLQAANAARPNFIQTLTGLDKPHLSNTLTGIITFSFLSILAGAATASWWFLKTLRPFFAGLITLFVLVGTRLAVKQPYFQPHEPDDFLKAIKT